MPPPPPPPQQHSWPTDNNAVIALVCGIAAFVTSCFPAGYVALWLGLKARKEATARGEPGNSPNQVMALVGAIIGGIIGAIWTVVILIYIVMIVFAVGVAAVG